MLNEYLLECTNVVSSNLLALHKPLNTKQTKDKRFFPIFQLSFHEQYSLPWQQEPLRKHNSNFLQQNRKRDSNICHGFGMNKTCIKFHW